uniref:Facilitated trehalose transporter Tret1-like isoform X3 n=1 Tax=Diabrotica virgifera virgifera TaxID=50390 RepID=A0A6P7GT47_DIAVI
MKSKSVITNLKTKEPKENELFQIFVMLVGSLGGLTCGMFVAWPSPFLLKIVEDKINYDITEQQASFFAVFSIVGVVVLTPLFIPLVNRIGTKKAIILSSIPYIAVWLIKAYVTNLYGLYGARLLVGCADALVLSCLPVYIGEIATPKIRGLWGNAFICSLFTGQCLVNILGAYLSVKTTSLISVFIPVLLLAIFPFMPNSPYFCIAKGRHEEAKQNLRRLRQKTDIEEEFKAIEAAVQRQLSESGSWKDLFSIRTNRKALFAAFFLRNSQLWGGMMTFAAYTQFIFIKSGTNVDPKISAIIYTAVSCISHTCSSLLSNKLGRRRAFMFSTFLAAIVLSFEAAFFLISDYYTDVNLESIQWFPLVGLVLYLLFCSFGLGTVPPLMLGELFSASVKTKAVAIVTSSFGLTGITVNNIFYYLFTYTGLFGPFLLFAAFNFLASLASFWIVPETKGKTLEEIQQMLKNKKNYK